MSSNSALRGPFNSSTQLFQSPSFSAASGTAIAGMGFLSSMGLARRLSRGGSRASTRAASARPGDPAEAGGGAGVDLAAVVHEEAAGVARDRARVAAHGVDVQARGVV